MRWGAWVQELVYLKRPVIKSYMQEAEKYEMTAFAFCLLAHVPPVFEDRFDDAEQFSGMEISKPKGWFLKNVELVIREAERRGLVVDSYGYMTPDVRRWFEVPPLRHRGELTRSDWHSYSDRFEDGYGKFISIVEQEFGDAMSHVNAVEPYLLPAVDAKIHDHIDGIWPGSLHGGRDEVHINPGEPMISGRYVAWDGWGYCRRRWKHTRSDGLEIVRPYACLPPTSGPKPQQVRQIKQYFKRGLLDAAGYGVERLYILPTSNWGVSSHAEAIDPNFKGHPGIASLDCEPWSDAFKAMRLAARNMPSPTNPLDDEISLTGATIASNAAPEIASWPVTATLLDVAVARLFIEQTHSGHWPLKELERSSGGTSMFEGNAWIGAIIDGELHFGTYEWIIPHEGEGRRKRLGAGGEHPDTARAIGPHVKSGPLATWVPRRGETVWFFSSSLARLGSRSAKNQRTNVVSIRWPY